MIRYYIMLFLIWPWQDKRLSEIFIVTRKTQIIKPPLPR